MSLHDTMGMFYSQGIIGFDEGRSFRAFKEISIPQGGDYTAQIVIPTPVLLQSLVMIVDEGAVRLETFSGGTPSGVFNDPFTTFKRNVSKPTSYVRQLTINGGGSVTGGVLLDILRVKADTNSSRANSVINSENEIRGVSPGTFYWKFTNYGSGTAEVLFKTIWEEMK